MKRAKVKSRDQICWCVRASDGQGYWFWLWWTSSAYREQAIKKLEDSWQVCWKTERKTGRVACKRIKIVELP